MARGKYSGFEMIENSFERLGRDSIRRIVEAGAKACAGKMQDEIQKNRHVRTGSMMQNVKPERYREFLGGGAMEVYPQDTDARGVSNTVKAYVINHGIGRNPTVRSRGRKERNRTGDKFITGNKTAMEQVVRQAMQEENNRIISESGGNKNG